MVISPCILILFIANFSNCNTWKRDVNKLSASWESMKQSIKVWIFEQNKFLIIFAFFSIGLTVISDELKGLKWWFQFYMVTILF